VTTPAAFAKLAQVAADARPAQAKRVVTGEAKAARPKARAAAEATRA
jgi:hypothetical protein